VNGFSYDEVDDEAKRDESVLESVGAWTWPSESCDMAVMVEVES
jgi:hypothetical protein